MQGKKTLLKHAFMLERERKITLYLVLTNFYAFMQIIGKLG